MNLELSSTEEEPVPKPSPVVKPIPIRSPARAVVYSQVAFTKRTATPVIGARSIKFDEFPMTVADLYGSRPYNIVLPPDPTQNVHSARGRVVSASHMHQQRAPAPLVSHAKQQQPQQQQQQMQLQQHQNSPQLARLNRSTANDASPMDIKPDISRPWAAYIMSHTPSPPQARRRLILEGAQSTGGKRRAARSIEGNSAKRRSNASYLDDGTCSPSLGAPRLDNSLLLLTKRFIELRHTTPDGVINLNDAAATLQVQKRRLYDITNVLEGISMVEKVGKNSIRWCESDDPSETTDNGHQARQLVQQNRWLEKEESELDEALSVVHECIDSAKTDPCEAPYAYTTYANLRAIDNLQRNTLIAIRAPHGCAEVSDPVRSGKYEMKVRSREQQVFLMPDVPDEEATTTTSVTGNPTDGLSLIAEVDSNPFASPMKTALLSGAITSLPASHNPVTLTSTSSTSSYMTLTSTLHQNNDNNITSQQQQLDTLNTPRKDSPRLCTPTKSNVSARLLQMQNIRMPAKPDQASSNLTNPDEYLCALANVVTSRLDENLRQTNSGHDPLANEHVPTLMRL